MREFSALKLDADEHTMLKFRKHWFILLQRALGTIVSVVFVPLVFVMVALAGLDPSALLPASLATFLSLWWLLVIWLALAVIWTNYYLDLWLVTDKRLVSIDQTGLFKREVTTLPLSNVQDVTVEQYGIIQTLPNFGTLTVQTAGPTTNNMVIRGIAHPSVVRDTIVRQCEMLKRLRATPDPFTAHS